MQESNTTLLDSGKRILQVQGDYLRVKAWIGKIARIAHARLDCSCPPDRPARVDITFYGSELTREHVERLIDALLGECPGRVTMRNVGVPNDTPLKH